MDSLRASFSSPVPAPPLPPVAISLGDGLLVAYLADAAFICLENPIPCAACHELHCWFVNRFGSTLCLACDAIPYRRKPCPTT